MMAKDDPNLAKLNDSLTAMKGDGALAEIHKKWFGAAPPAGSSTVTWRRFRSATQRGERTGEASVPGRQDCRDCPRAQLRFARGCARA